MKQGSDADLAHPGGRGSKDVPLRSRAGLKPSLRLTSKRRAFSAGRLSKGCLRVRDLLRAGGLLALGGSEPHVQKTARRQRRDLQAHLDLSCSALLSFPDTAFFFSSLFNKLKVCGNPALLDDG